MWKGGGGGGEASLQKELLRARLQRENSLKGLGWDGGDAGDVAGEEECFQGVCVCVCVCLFVCVCVCVCM